MLTQDIIKEALKTVTYPGFEKDIVSYGFLKHVDLDGDKVTLSLDIPSSAEEVSRALEKSIVNRLVGLDMSENNIIVNIKKPDIAQRNAMGKNIAPQIKNFLMVSSGKGGVGKSTTTVNIAIALAQQGKKVGILDADIYGPNIPRMIGVGGNKPKIENGKVIPLEAFGLEVMSMGLIYEEGESLIWRGPMIMRAVEQLLRDVAWSELDVLVIDMPPGTGDAQLTLAQSVPVTAGVTVSTPQSVSLDDSARSLAMFKKLNIPIAGIIENMSGFICPESGKEYDIFGKGTTQPLAEKYNTFVLAQIPIEPNVRIGGDEGKPIVYFHSDSVSAKEYMKAAHRVWDEIERINSEGGASNAQIQPTPAGGAACH